MAQEDDSEIIKQLSESSNVRADSLLKVEETLQYIADDSGISEIVTTEFKDALLEYIAVSPAFLSAQTPQDASNAVIASFERQLTQMNIPNDVDSKLRRNFILTYMREK